MNIHTQVGIGIDSDAFVIFVIEMIKRIKQLDLAKTIRKPTFAHLKNLYNKYGKIRAAFKIKEL